MEGPNIFPSKYNIKIVKINSLNFIIYLTENNFNKDLGKELYYTIQI